MKQVLLFKFHAVGMQHRHKGELTVGRHYQVYPEVHNPWDKNALAIKLKGKDHSDTLAYVKRDEARCLATLFREGLVVSGMMVLKPKETPTRTRYGGPQQVVNLGFYSNDGALPRIRNVLQQLPSSVHYEIK